MKPKRIYNEQEKEQNFRAMFTVSLTCSVLLIYLQLASYAVLNLVLRFYGPESVFDRESFLIRNLSIIFPTLMGLGLLISLPVFAIAFWRLSKRYSASHHRVTILIVTNSCSWVMAISSGLLLFGSIFIRSTGVLAFVIVAGVIWSLVPVMMKRAGVI